MLRISFDSPQEEAAHYREKYRRILDMLDETRAELGEKWSQGIEALTDDKTSFNRPVKNWRMSSRRSCKLRRSSRQS